MLQIRRAAPGDFGTIVDLIEDASNWLRGMDTNQWQEPWPDITGRDERIARGLMERHTWVVMDKGQVIGTVTSKPYGNENLWSVSELRVPACYVSRLVVQRAYAGQRIGEALVDFVAARAKAEYGAACVRIDVWTTNSKLHDYYKARGFDFVGLCQDAEYPSAALFRMPIMDDLVLRGPRLSEVCDTAIPAAPAAAIGQALACTDVEAKTPSPALLYRLSLARCRRFVAPRRGKLAAVTPTGGSQNGAGRVSRLSHLYGTVFAITLLLSRR